jgi:hypothetical protein
MTDLRKPNIKVFLTSRRWRAAAATCAIGVVVASSALVLSAHERRVVGGYTIVVGFRSEPAFEDEVNGADIGLVRTSDQRPINASAGDVVDLTVQVQLRKSESFDSDVVQAANLEKPTQGFGTLNRYFSLFRPTVDGTYAFRVRGTVWDKSDPAGIGPITIDETYVCGAGSLGLGAFNCVRDPQPFPQGALDARGHDRHGYIDDDSLRPFRQHHHGDNDD